MGVIRFQDALSIRIGAILAGVVISPIKFVAMCSPLPMVRIFPKSICSLFGSICLTENSSKHRCFAWANRAAKSKFSGHRKASFFIKANYALKNYDDFKFAKYISDEVYNELANQEKQDFFRVWSVHNASQYTYINFIDYSIKNLEQSDSKNESESRRYLPEHTTNMGHLGSLYLYANYYRKFDPERKIVIWPSISPNKFYLKELLKIFPLTYELLPGKPETSKLKVNHVDTLIYSRIKPGNWRYETGSACPCAQDFPEYLISDDFKLSCDENLTSRALFELQKIKFDPKKWFVILHIKEHSMGYSFGGETRDAAIASYRKSCDLIYSLGGQVVRMGGPNFPKLQQNFPAIDYAHSEVSSDELDFWLWANCKFWVGNGNGASFAIIPFKKPRLVTNVWPLNPFGPIYDKYIPKLIYDGVKGRLLSAEELISLKLGRSMKKDLFKINNLSLVENSPELLMDATLELYNSVERGLQNKTIPFTDFELGVNISMKASSNTPIMRIPSAFENFMENLK
jgi:putative glycosyltransferase (TIGR04372 family)